MRYCVEPQGDGRVAFTNAGRRGPYKAPVRPPLTSVAGCSLTAGGGSKVGGLGGAWGGLAAAAAIVHGTPLCTKKGSGGLGVGGHRRGATFWKHFQPRPAQGAPGEPLFSRFTSSTSLRPSAHSESGPHPSKALPSGERQRRTTGFFDRQTGRQEFGQINNGSARLRLSRQDTFSSLRQFPQPILQPRGRLGWTGACFPSAQWLHT